MAKKQQDLGDIFKRTEQPGQEPEQPNPVKARGVGLRQSEWWEMEGIAEEFGMTVHELSVYAIRYFLNKFHAGEVQTETRKTLSGLEPLKPEE